MTESPPTSLASQPLVYLSSPSSSTLLLEHLPTPEGNSKGWNFQTHQTPWKWAFTWSLPALTCTTVSHLGPAFDIFPKASIRRYCFYLHFPADLLQISSSFGRLRFQQPSSGLGHLKGQPQGSCHNAKCRKISGCVKYMHWWYWNNFRYTPPEPQWQDPASDLLIPALLQSQSLIGQVQSSRGLKVWTLHKTSRIEEPYFLLNISKFKVRLEYLSRKT